MSATASPASKQWFGHPRGLSTLFFTEMWERFSYYGMRSLLILFLVASVQNGGFGLTDQKAAAIYGLYTAGVYLMSLPGGWIADRLLGQRGAVFLGGCIIAAGHFSMAIPTVWSFYLGLCLIVCGTGLLKPNASAMVGDLYPEGGARRDSGFSFFYMGINSGAFIGPLICGPLGERVNWHLGFGAAGIGMVCGLIQYRYGQKYLGTAGLLRPESAVPETRARAGRQLMVGLAVVAAVLVAVLFFGKLSPESAARGTGIVIVSSIVLYFAAMLLWGGLTTPEKKRTIVIFVFFLASSLFWAGYEQAGSSLNLFASRLTDRFIGSWEMPASTLQAVPALCVILLSPVFSWVWLRLQDRGPSMPAKLGLGLVILAFGFFVMVVASQKTHGGADKVTAWWLVTTYFLHTVGELCLSPVGLSSVTKLAPRRLVGQMMGTFFMGNALGNLIAGLTAGSFSTMPLPELFGTVAKVTGAGGVILLIFSPLLRRLIGVLPAGAPPRTVGESEVPA
jgi:proton-dependent oligopeptide transporter, POT family